MHLKGFNPVIFYQTVVSVSRFLVGVHLNNDYESKDYYHNEWRYEFN